MTTTTSYRLSGLTCQHCVASVTEELSALPEVNQVNVDLVTDGISTVTVISDGPLEEESVRQAVAEAGYDFAAD